MVLNVDGIKPPYPSDALEGRRIFLASNSPRRRELLAMILPDFLIPEAKNVDESYPHDIPPHEVPEFLALKKAAAYRNDLTPGDVLITADTVVILDGEILGKPADEDDACHMLRKLSGRTQCVVTGVAVTCRTTSGVDVKSFSEHTEVTFGDLTDGEIEEYVRRYRPLDKAGAYGIQEWTGAAIERIDGCFYNVMGLPIHRLYKILTTL